MVIRKKTETLSLLIGDLLILAVSLYTALAIRHGAVPDIPLLKRDFLPFLIIFAVSIAVYFIAGLYEGHTRLFRGKLPTTVLHAQTANAVLAVTLFYFVPVLGITPKTILFLYLFLSSLFIVLWRVYGFNFLIQGEKEHALLIGEGSEIRELYEEVNHNPRYTVSFVSLLDPKAVGMSDVQEEILRQVSQKGITLIAVDLRDERLEPCIPYLYTLIFSGVRFVDTHKLYEEIFRRIPVSLVRDNWFLENVSSPSPSLYDFLKRFMDIVISIPLLLVPIVCYPFVLIAVKFEDGGPVFTYQKRVGENNRIVEFVKFRTMLFNDEGKWEEKGVANRITRVGAFLRKTRLDEFPQLWNVLKGEASLIGPRPEFPEPVRHYVEAIPYFNVRHLIKPGLSGWAQLHGEHAHHGTDIRVTRNKLSYDLFYIKNRSFTLDLKIALQTLKVLLSRSGV